MGTSPHLDQPSSYNGSDPLTISNATTGDRVYSGAFGQTYLISPNTVSSFRATLNRTVVQKTPDNGPSWATLGVQNVNSLIPNFSRVTVSGGFAYGGASATPSEFNTTSFQFAEDMTVVTGAHQIGFGINYIHPELNFVSGLNAGGGITFNGSVTGLGLADFLLGDASGWSQGSFSLGYDRQNYISLYVQDSWKINSRLTVNYGVRWEPYIAPYSKYKWFNHFDPTLFAAGVHSSVYVNAPAGLIFPGDPQYTAGSAPENSTFNLFAPRFGVVWDPQGNGRMTIRAAYGIFTDREHLFYNDAFANDPPYGNNITEANVNFVSPWAGYPGGNPFPIQLSRNTVFPLFGAYVTHDLNAKPTYLNQWNLSIQRQIGQDWLLTANYIGNNTIHLWTGNQANPAVFLGLGACTINGTLYAVCSTTGNTNQRRLLYLENAAQGQYYAGISQMDDGGTATYDGLLLSIQHRLSHGVTLLANYTWSHCISDLANSELGTAGPLYMIPNDRRADRSNCVTSDQRQIMNISAVAQSPAFTNRLLRLVAGGWQVAPILSVKSAQLFTVTTGIDNALTGQANQRPNLVLANPYPANSTVRAWLNPVAFAYPAPGSYGNLGANNLHGPGILQFDLGLFRLFVIREKQTLQFRAEAFNVLNTLNPSTPVATFNSPNFGQITTDINGSQGQTGDPRIIQLALKYVF